MFSLVYHFFSGFLLLQEIPNGCTGYGKCLCNGSDWFSMFSQFQKCLLFSHRQLSGLHIGYTCLTINAVYAGKTQSWNSVLFLFLIINVAHLGNEKHLFCNGNYLIDMSLMKNIKSIENLDVFRIFIFSAHKKSASFRVQTVCMRKDKNNTVSVLFVGICRCQREELGHGYGTDKKDHSVFLMT